jgi:hypothetical protein
VTKIIYVVIVLLLLMNQAHAQLRYNDVQQKSFHNSYQRDEGLLDLLIYHRARSIELDIRNTKIGRPTNDGDWYVYHIPVVDTGTSCDRLSECLQELRVFDETHPHHEVITLWFDVNTGWGGTHTPSSFDALLRRYLPESDFVKPSDLLAACPGASDLQAAVTGSCDWPTLDSLKGKWIIVTTDGDYSNNRPTRLGFSSGQAADRADIFRNKNAIIFNLEGENNIISNYIHENNFVSRRYVINDAAGFASALSNHVHQVATNKANFHKDTWSKTHNAAGWPFTCMNANCDLKFEDEDIIGVNVNSDDIWGKSDHFVFLNQDQGAAQTRWVTAINEASSHVQEWAKGCLMARASISSGSPYFAVCRAADNKKLFIQYRDRSGASSGAVNANIVTLPGLDQENLTYVRLDVGSSGKCAAGFGSQDGLSWTQIGTRCFNDTLKLQGVAASSHGNQIVKHLFSGLSLWGIVQGVSTFRLQNIGTVRSAQAFDGSFIQ